MPINGPIAPLDTEDTYATHLAEYGKGGIYAVTSNALRDAITEDRRALGLTVIVTSGTIDNAKVYTLDSGLSNSDWTEVFATNRGVQVLASAAPGGFKNKIIGGDFLTNPWQRGTIFTPKNANAWRGYYFVERWEGYTADCFSVGTCDANSDTARQILRTSKETYTDGTAALRIDCTTSLTAGLYSYGGLFYTVEGTDYAALHRSPFTLSFWVNSNVPGKYAVNFRNRQAGLSDATWITSYTINAANTWEKKVITVDIPPSESGGNLFTFDTTAGLLVSWMLSVSNANTTDLTEQWLLSAGTDPGTANPGYLAPTGTANACMAGSIFKIKEVQLELGTTASNFEHLSAATVLQQCQRYYQKSWAKAIAPLTTDLDTLSSDALLQNNALPNASYYDNLEVLLAQDDVYRKSVAFSTPMRGSPTVAAYVGIAGSPIVVTEQPDILAINEKGFLWEYTNATQGDLYVAWFAEANIPNTIAIA